jgi:hypothetical protein
MTGPRPGHMTAAQIAAANRRERDLAVDEAVAANRRERDLAVDEAVAAGPFDGRPIDPDIPAPRCPVCGVPLTEPPTSDDCPQPEDHAPTRRPAITTDVQADLRSRLDRQLDPAGADDRFAPGDWPKIVEGFVVPAISVDADPLATWVLIPVGEIASIGLTARAVGVSPRGPGRWLAVWIGDDLDERNAVLTQFATDVSHARRLYR